MKPRHLITESECCTGLTLALVDHDGRHYLECEGRQVDAGHLGFPAQSLIGLMCGPFRPARQPRLVFLGLGFGHAVKAAREALPQAKATFVVLPETPDLPGWLSAHLSENPLDDERVLIDKSPPFSRLGPDFADSQGIFADLDHLDALHPKNWAIDSPEVLANYHDRLKLGGLLGLLSSRPSSSLEKELRKAGFELACELAPLSEKSKKNRTLYLARKGQYHRSR